MCLDVFCVGAYFLNKLFLVGSLFLAQGAVRQHQSLQAVNHEQFDFGFVDQVGHDWAVQVQTYTQETGSKLFRDVSLAIEIRHIAEVPPVPSQLLERNLRIEQALSLTRKTWIYLFCKRRGGQLETVSR